VAFSLTLLITPIFAQVPLLLAPVWILSSSLICFSCCVINHNHMHCLIFSSPRANSIFNCIITLAKGHTATTIVVPHNLNHHFHSGTEEDWIATSHAGSGWGLIRMFRYILSASRSMNHKRKLESAPQPTARQKKQLRVERFCLYAFAGIFLLIAPAKTLLFIFIPWGIAVAILIGVNLLQHDGCDPNTPYLASRNFVGKLNNWLFFNNGYHTVHHLHPELHWSMLPGEHEKLQAQIPRELIQPSATRFFVKHYLLA